jgi:L-fuculokinase
MTDARLVGVLDVGKTNVKLLVLDRQGRIRDEAASPSASLPGPPYPHLDSEGVWRWLLDRLAVMAARWPIDTLVVTTHGGAAALVDERALVLPILDYEFEPPDDGFAAAYRAIAPPFAETFAPLFPAGLNLARQIFWQQQAFAEAFGRVRHILCYPQYLAWRLSGIAASEVTSLGAHTHLWAPQQRRFSSLVDRLGWRRLFPPLRAAWERLGPIRPEIPAQTGLAEDCAVLCGIHDSNAALLLYLRSQQPGFALASTGTWLILLRPGHALDTLDPARDMLANVDVTGQPVATARFMGGREYVALAGEAAAAQVAVGDVQRLVDQGTFALPSFAPAGPFPDRAGRIVGPQPEAAARSALATLYVALMTDVGFDLLEARGDLLVDGGFAGNPVYAGLLAALRRGQAVKLNGAKEGTATGASLLASWHEPEVAVPLALAPVAPLEIAGLDAYAREWRRRAERP